MRIDSPTTNTTWIIGYKNSEQRTTNQQTNKTHTEEDYLESTHETVGSGTVDTMTELETKVNTQTDVNVKTKQSTNLVRFGIEQMMEDIFLNFYMIGNLTDVDTKITQNTDVETILEGTTRVSIDGGDPLIYPISDTSNSNTNSSSVIEDQIAQFIFGCRMAKQYDSFLAGIKAGFSNMDKDAQLDILTRYASLMGSVRSDHSFSSRLELLLGNNTLKKSVQKYLALNRISDSILYNPDQIAQLEEKIQDPHLNDYEGLRAAFGISTGPDKQTLSAPVELGYYSGQKGASALYDAMARLASLKFDYKRWGVKFNQDIDTKDSKVMLTYTFD